MSTAIVAVCAVVGGVIGLIAIRVVRKTPYFTPLGICVIIAAGALLARNLK